MNATIAGLIQPLPQDVDVALLKYLLTAIGGGGIALVGAVLLVLWLVPRWIDKQFTEALDELKRTHERELAKARELHEKQLESLKYRAQILLDRTSRVQQHEIRVLARSWRLLQDALGMAAIVVRPTQSYPDFKGMSPEEIKHSLGQSELEPHEQSLVLAAKDCAAEFQRLVTPRRHVLARNSRRRFHNFLLNNQIFVPSDLVEKLHALDGAMSEALESFALAKIDGDKQLARAAWKNIDQEAVAVREVIERLVRKRLSQQEEL